MYIYFLSYQMKKTRNIERENPLLDKDDDPRSKQAGTAKSNLKMRSS